MKKIYIPYLGPRINANNTHANNIHMFLLSLNSLFCADVKLKKARYLKN